MKQNGLILLTGDVRFRFRYFMVFSPDVTAYLSYKHVPGRSRGRKCTEACIRDFAFCSVDKTGYEGNAIQNAIKLMRNVQKQSKRKIGKIEERR